MQMLTSMFQGLFVLLRGIKHLLFTKGLRTLLLKMWFALLLLSGFMMVLVLYTTSWLAAFWLPLGDAWFWQITAYVVWVVSFIVSASMGVVGYTLFSGMVISPYLDALAAQLDQSSSLSVPIQSGLVQVKQSAHNALKPMIMLLGWGVLAGCVFLFPIIGPFIAAVLWFYACMRFMIFELIDVPCSRQHMSYQTRKALIDKHALFYYGFSLVAMVAMMIPIVNTLVHPGAVVGLMRDANVAGLK